MRRLSSLVTYFYVKEYIPKGDYQHIIEKTSQILYFNNIDLNPISQQEELFAILQKKSLELQLSWEEALETKLYRYAPKYVLWFENNEWWINVEVGESLEMFRRNVNRFLCEIMGIF